MYTILDGNEMISNDSKLRPKDEEIGKDEKGVLNIVSEKREEKTNIPGGPINSKHPSHSPASISFCRTVMGLL